MRFGVIDQGLGGVVTVVIQLNDELLLDDHVGVGVVDDFFALVGDRDPVGGGVELALCHLVDHGRPRRLDELGDTVEEAADVPPGVVVPALSLGLASEYVVEGEIGVLHGHRDGSPLQIGQFRARPFGGGRGAPAVVVESEPPPHAATTKARTTPRVNSLYRFFMNVDFLSGSQSRAKRIKIVDPG